MIGRKHERSGHLRPRSAAPAAFPGVRTGHEGDQHRWPVRRPRPAPEPPGSGRPPSATEKAGARPEQTESPATE